MKGIPVDDDLIHWTSCKLRDRWARLLRSMLLFLWTENRTSQIRAVIKQLTVTRITRIRSTPPSNLVIFSTCITFAGLRWMSWELSFGKNGGKKKPFRVTNDPTTTTRKQTFTTHTEASDRNEVCMRPSICIYDR